MLQTKFLGLKQVSLQTFQVVIQVSLFHVKSLFSPVPSLLSLFYAESLFPQSCNLESKSLKIKLSRRGRSTVLLLKPFKGLPLQLVRVQQLQTLLNPSFKYCTQSHFLYFMSNLSLCSPATWNLCKLTQCSRPSSLA